MEGRLKSEDSGGKRTTEIIATIKCLFHGMFIISYDHRICCDRFQYACFTDR